MKKQNKLLKEIKEHGIPLDDKHIKLVGTIENLTKEQTISKVLKLIRKWYLKFSYKKLTYNMIYELEQKIKEIK